MAPVYHVCERLAKYRYPEDGSIEDSGQLDQLKPVFSFSILSNAVHCAVEYRGHGTVGERLVVEEDGLRRYLTDSERKQVCDLLSDKAGNAPYVLYTRPDYGRHEKFPLCANNRDDAIREARSGIFSHVERIEEHDSESGELLTECFLRKDDLWTNARTGYHIILFPETSKILRVQASDFGTTMKRLKDFGESPDIPSDNPVLPEGHDTLESLFEAYDNMDSGFSGYCKFVARDRPEEELRWLDREESAELERIEGKGGENNLDLITEIPSETGYYAHIMNECRYMLDRHGEHAIFHAVENPEIKVDVLDWLKEHGAEINRVFPDNDESTPMHRAALCDNVVAMKWLQQQGVDVDVRDKRKQTPMHRAAFLNALKAMKWLHEQGADFNAQDNFGHAPIHMAVRSNNVEALELLKNFGVDMTVKNNDGMTLIEFARIPHARGRSKDAMEWLDRILKTDAGLNVKTDVEPDGMEMS